jgi:hypothetical protein
MYERSGYMKKGKVVPVLIGAACHENMGGVVQFCSKPWHRTEVSDQLQVPTD